MHVRCPHCQNPIEIACEDPAQELTCPSCGSSFSLIEGSSTISYTQAARKHLGHFELLEQLGIGAFGSVWRARDTKLDRMVAVKIPRKDQLSRGEMEQFFREARAAAQLRHPGIVSVHEVGREGDTIYIVSDLIQGVTLSDWLSGQRQTSREAAEVCLQVAQALHHAHEQGVIHRDLKPSNIMLDHTGRPHLMDFGLAKREAGEITMTMEGQLLGTPAYMSPEQARGEGHTVDRRADIYSLGVLLFQMLTGELPFHGTPRMLMHQVLYSEPRSPRSLNDRIPRDLETICLTAMAKEPGRRYATAQALADDLQSYLNGEPIQARPVGRLERGWRWCRRNPMSAALMLAVSLTLATGGAASSYFSLRALAEADRANLMTKVQELQSLHTRQLAHTASRKELIELCIEAGDQQNSFGKAVQARELYERAIDISNALRQEWSAPEIPSIEFWRARAFLGLGDVVRGSGQTKNAEECYKRAIEIAEGTLDQPITTDFQLALREALSRLAKAKARAAENTRGVLDVSEAELSGKYVRTLQKMAAGAPPISDFQNLLANAYERLGKAQMASGQGEAASAAFTKAIQILDTLAVENPSSQEIQSRLEELNASMNLETAAAISAHSSTGDTATNFVTRIDPTTHDGNVRVNSIGMQLVIIPAGTFQIGSPVYEFERQPDEKQHRVNIDSPFEMGVYEVTQNEFEKVMGKNPSYFSHSGDGRRSVEGLDTSRFPVENVAWEDAQVFCNQLGRKEGKRYRLPTEAEWEYACRARSQTRFSFGDVHTSAPANPMKDLVSPMTANGDFLRTTKVGTYLPNAFGLYDMHGNVGEWCADIYSEDYQPPSAGPEAFSQRVIRGGGWNSVTHQCRSAARAQGFAGSNVGFRVVCEINQPLK